MIVETKPRPMCAKRVWIEAQNMLIDLAKSIVVIIESMPLTSKETDNDQYYLR